jgi:hypothetical protein
VLKVPYHHYIDNTNATENKMTFTDNTTGKMYSINGQFVTQIGRSGVVTVYTIEDVQGWMDMMGFKAPKAVKARLVKNHSTEYGKQSYSVEAMDEVTLDKLVAALNEAGWIKECTFCQEDNGYDGDGVTMEYCVDARDEAEFKAAWKVAKKQVQ